jgi:hypothetical protein
MTDSFRMPKYFFKLYEEGFLGDPNGTELPNLETAREHAGQLAQTIAQSGYLPNGWSVTVMDERKRPLVTIAFPSLLHKKSSGNTQ